MVRSHHTPELRSAKEKFLYLHQQLTTLNRMISVGSSHTFKSGFSSYFVPQNRHRRSLAPYSPGYSGLRSSAPLFRFKRLSPHASLWRNADRVRQGSVHCLQANTCLSH